jgi:glycerol-3-phosphate dehydrogenase (NAD(P)+)
MMEMSMVSKAITLLKRLQSQSRYGAKTIIDAVYQILYEGKDAKRTFKELTDKLD